jgi:hypothetical protein
VIRVTQSLTLINTPRGRELALLSRMKEAIAASAWFREYAPRNFQRHYSFNSVATVISLTFALNPPQSA